MMGGQGGMAMGARYSMPVNNQSNYMQQQGSTGGNWGGIATPMYPQVAMSPVNPNASMQQSNIMDSVLAQQLGQMQINPAQSVSSSISHLCLIVHLIYSLSPSCFHICCIRMYNAGSEGTMLI